MKKMFLLSFCAIILSAGIISGIAKAEEIKYQEEKILAESLVNEAAELIEEKGEAALAIITAKGGKFNKGDSYVFITSGETGADIVNPAFQEVEGLPPESYNNPVFKESQIKIVNAVKNQDAAWVEYLWPKPGETGPSKKMSYLKKIIVNGKSRIIGAGFYPKE